MKIDLFKLNNLGHVDIDSDLIFPEDYFNEHEIRNLINGRVKGTLSIDYEDSLSSDLLISGTFILPCSLTLEDVSYDFEVKIEENLGKFADFYNKNKNTLDILPFIWENIVSEVPIRVVKNGAKVENLNGEGWELVSDE